MFNALFTSVFNMNGDPTALSWRTVTAGMLKPQLHQLGEYKSLGSYEFHSRVLKELANVIMRPLSISFQCPWESGKYCPNF